MINRHSIIVISVAAVISAGIWVIAWNRQHSKEQERVLAKVFQGPMGWGYDIWVNDTLFIHQECVPAIEMKKGFAEKQQAEKAAGLVLQKMQQHKLPTLTKFDVEHICSPGN
ncbi:MAG: DUF4907 domain-containing protein [Bacteroidota bacterium]|nr:DUF4907 domain-containing protein [Bacteroidota bacterium]